MKTINSGLISRLLLFSMSSPLRMSIVVLKSPDLGPCGIPRRGVFFPKKVLSGFENTVFKSFSWIPLNLRLKNQLAVCESWADSDTTIGFVSKFCAEWCN